MLLLPSWLACNVWQIAWLQIAMIYSSFFLISIVLPRRPNQYWSLCLCLCCPLSCWRPLLLSAMHEFIATKFPNSINTDNKEKHEKIFIFYDNIFTRWLWMWEKSSVWTSPFIGCFKCSLFCYMFRVPVVQDKMVELHFYQFWQTHLISFRL